MSKGTQPKGFAGLASLVSNLEENDASPAHEAPTDDELDPGSEADHVRDVAKDSSVSAVTEEEDEGRRFSAASSLSSEAKDERAATTQGGVDSDGRERETETPGAETTGATSAGRSADPSPSREEWREPVASHQAEPSRPRSSALKWLLLLVFGVVALYVYDLVQEEERRAKSDWTFTPEPRSTTPLDSRGAVDEDPDRDATPPAPQSVTPPPRGAEREPDEALAEARREPSRGANPSETSPATKSQAEPEAPVDRVQASDLEYSQPPAGRDKVLNVAQIRWCLREEIRIETLRTQATKNAEIVQFNRLVSGYNSRCGSYRYRPAALARAQLDVEEQRREIVAGISPAWSSSPLESPAEPMASPSESEIRDTSEAEDRTESVREAPTNTRLLTREIQEALTALGYEPGPIDGIYGPKTKRAIQAFERAMGMTPTGAATIELWWSLLGEVSRQED